MPSSPTWKVKYQLNLLRPVTYIQLAFDANWVPPLMETPPFPEYPSGHSVQSGSAAAVLEAFYGADTAFEDRAHNDRGWGPQRFRSFARRGRPGRALAAVRRHPFPQRHRARHDDGPLHRRAGAGTEHAWRAVTAQSYTAMMATDLDPAVVAGLARRGDATVRHLRQVLLWPLRLMPLPSAPKATAARPGSSCATWPIARPGARWSTSSPATRAASTSATTTSSSPSCRTCSASCTARARAAATASATTAARRCACSAATTSPRCA